MVENVPPKLAGDLRHSVTRLYLALRRNSPLPDISAAQSSAAATLYDHGPMRMGELAERESIRMPTATSLVDGLIRHGLATREPDPDDRRAVVISLTDHGQTILQQIRNRRDDKVNTALAGMSDEHLAALAAAAPALRDLRARLENHEH